MSTTEKEPGLVERLRGEGPIIEEGTWLRAGFEPAAATLLVAKSRLEREAATALEAQAGEIERLRKVCIQTEHEVQQILGKALGYPWFKDDQRNFPGTTEEHGVCVGDHVAATLATEAAERLATQVKK